MANVMVRLRWLLTDESSGVGSIVCKGLRPSVGEIMSSSIAMVTSAGVQVGHSYIRSVLEDPGNSTLS